MDLKQNKFLIVLPYYNRPKLVINALESVKRLDYDNWELAFIDDGSEHEGEPEFHKLFVELLPRTKFYQSGDSVEKKQAQGGSRHGEYMNQAIEDSDADIVIILCDDDALMKDSLTNLNRWFNENPEKQYCYSHTWIFNPELENPFELTHKVDHFTNRTEALNPAYNVDSSQVVFRASVFKEYDIWYPSPSTKNNDAYMFGKCFDKFGNCEYTGFDIQYKGWFSGQLGNRNGDSEFNYKQ